MCLLKWQGGFTSTVSLVICWNLVSQNELCCHFITARNEVRARLCFYTCLWFCSQEGGSASVHAGIQSPDQTPPWDQTKPPRGQTPPRSRPPGIRPPTPGADPHGPDAPEQCMLGDMGNKRAVRILLECILVENKLKLDSIEKCS